MQSVLTVDMYTAAKNKVFVVGRKKRKKTAPEVGNRMRQWGLGGDIGPLSCANRVAGTISPHLIDMP